MTFDKIASRADQCTVLENVTGNSPCNLNSGTICSGSQQCTCSGISYFLAAACQVCANDATLSWEQYATTSHCSGLPEPVPSPFPTQPDPNHVIPSWVVVMAAATPSPSTFDPAVASAIVTSLAGGSPTTSSTTTTRPPQTLAASSTAPLSTTPNPSSQSSLTSATSSSRRTQSDVSASSPIVSNISSTGNTNSPASSMTRIESPTVSPSASGAASEDAQAASHQNSAPAIIVGILIALFVMVLVAIVLLCLRRRRRRSQIQSPDVYTRSTGRLMPIPFLNVTTSVPSDPSPVVTEKALEAESPEYAPSVRYGTRVAEHSAVSWAVNVCGCRKDSGSLLESPRSECWTSIAGLGRDLRADGADPRFGGSSAIHGFTR
ncbi:hypothetical protein MSAN_02503400 [Mycena sanguinolenta]|uniref:Uncharacterized protein n=1 Tax=Mycena sanguinolenta TaxID=230812 RepID=A0A8H6WT41_9AGAR|nr:hypothetical protein MSAN_02503400 [Mycena sanguinolenta]